MPPVLQGTHSHTVPMQPHPELPPSALLTYTPNSRAGSPPQPRQPLSIPHFPTRDLVPQGQGTDNNYCLGFLLSVSQEAAKTATTPSLNRQPRQGRCPGGLQPGLVLFLQQVLRLLEGERRAHSHTTKGFHATTLCPAKFKVMVSPVQVWLSTKPSPSAGSPWAATIVKTGQNQQMC